MRLTWPEQARALDVAVDRAALLAGLRRLRMDHPGEVRAWLATTYPWQAGCPTVGDETVRPFCWCHGPWKGGDPAERVADELLELRGWYLAVRDFVTTTSFGDDPEALARAIAEAVGEVVQLGIHDSWYQVVPGVVAWLLEANGVAVDPGLEDRVMAQCELSFTSWTTPKPAAVRSVAEAIAWDALEAVAAARWPDAGPPGS